MLERLKANADWAYSQLVERAENGDALRGGRLDVEKAINNLQNQLSEVQAQISTAESERGRLEDAQTEAANAQTRRETFEDAVDWQAERSDLRSELKGLVEEIANRKTIITAGEQRSAAVAKYGPLIAKWHGNEVVPVKSIGQM
jgi:predicted  nucleic acid-binding Zn-ribbon protein